MLMSILACIGTGLLYYIGAMVGVVATSLPSGIAVIWPPNAILLAAFLTLPRRTWIGLAAAALVAEVLADYSAFPVYAAVLFGLVNIGECALAAAIMMRVSNSEHVQPDWSEPRELALFILIAFFVASPIAALAGASVYSFVLLDQTPFTSLWRIWWFGDATGLIAIAPFMHMLFNHKVYWRDARYLSAGGLEWTGLVVTTLGTCFLVFSVGITAGHMLALTPLLVLLAPFWAAVRLGPLPGAALAATVALYAAIATAAGHGPFVTDTPERTALLIQEVIVLFIVIVLFAAAFVAQNRKKSGSLRLYKSAIEATEEGILITEAGDDQPIIFSNQGFMEMTGYQPEEVLRQNCRFLNQPESDQLEVRKIKSAIQRQESVRVTLRNYRKDGTLFWNSLVINPIRDWRGETTHFVGIIKDISREVEQQHQLEDLLYKLQHANETLEVQVRQRTNELEDANRKLKRLALTDELTGVDNRRNLISHGHLEVMRCKRSGHAFSIMLLDIDHFKRLNDQYGHEAGDLVLKTFAQEMGETIRKIDTFGRWGGEEFMVIVYDSEQTDLQAIGEKILKRIAECKVPYKEHTLSITVSIGIATWQGGSFDQVVSMADRAMYRAKESGRNRLVIFNDGSGDIHVDDHRKY